MSAHQIECKMNSVNELLGINSYYIYIGVIYNIYEWRKRGLVRY